jgi:hypothetical protein
MQRRLWAIYDGVLALLTWGLIGIMVGLLLTGAGYVPGDAGQQAERYLRSSEFDFVSWTLDAIGSKAWQNSVDEQSYLSGAARSDIVRRYFKLRAQLENVQGQIARVYADPAVSDPAATSAGLRAQQNSLRSQMGSVQSLAEAVLQEQLSVHLTDLPYAFIISPREVIRQDANLDVSGALTLDQQVALEDQVSRSLKVSALVVPLGGIGTYPTMVAQSSDLNWIASVIGHEWTHNYLTFRPLGINYGTSGALRTMNETTAEGIGIELGALLIQRYYPDLAPPPPPFTNILKRDQPPPPPTQAPSFDFQAEMHDTRVTTDALLAQGKIDAAEAYMESRRRVFLAHGYQIRKLNQAYFAFYGAYEISGGGAAGSDPVGATVRLLRRRSPSIAFFVNTMATFSSFDQLRTYLGLPTTG